ncbi:MAG TPA: AAA family ATPase [Planctomycetaceae bacterium]|nr:AAA family ATPase [Planctomycetaceae bacterium]
MSIEANGASETTVAITESKSGLEDAPEAGHWRGLIPNADVDENGVFRVQRGDREVYETARLDHFSLLDIEPIRWLWPKRIPLGRLTLVEGVGRSGKSFVAADLAARVSRGAAWPGAAQGPELAGNVIYVYGEDRKGDTLWPRLARTGADFERIVILEGVATIDPVISDRGKSRSERPLSFPHDLGQLEFTARRHEARLVVIDPLPEFCRNGESLTQTLRSLDELAARCGLAIVATARSARQGSGGESGNRRSEAVRCLFNTVLDQDRESGRFLAPVRMSFCREPKWLPFEIVDGTLAWGAETESVPLSACRPGGSEDAASILREVMQWLQETLREEDLPASSIHRRARECGYSAHTLRRARRRLGIRAYRQGFGFAGWWCWTLRQETAVIAGVNDRHEKNGTKRITNGKAAGRNGRGAKTRKSGARLDRARLRKETLIAAAAQVMAEFTGMREANSNGSSLAPG